MDSDSDSDDVYFNRIITVNDTTYIDYDEAIQRTYERLWRYRDEKIIPVFDRENMYTFTEFIYSALNKKISQ